MAEGTRVPLDVARDIATALTIAIEPYCYRVEICGSIRRQSETVGDIDLLCEPIVKPVLDLFGQPTNETRDLLTGRLDWMVGRGHLEKRLNVKGQPSWGPDLKRAVFCGMKVDIRACRDSDAWGAWMAISTGPALFNKALVTPRSKGGVLAPGLEIKDGFKVYSGGGRIPTPTEWQFFQALGLEHQRPMDRGARPLVAAPVARQRGGAGS